jgi:prepilin-type N-terminal cleavage/methylation domain-containing protein
MSKRFQDRPGFTLIEMLIVVIVLGILAMIIVPQITVSTEDAKVNTLKTNLCAMRNAIELYYHQHNEIYPGMKKTDGSGADIPTAAAAANAFVNQLTKYTEESGKAAGDSTLLTDPLGPYIKGGKLPENPFDADNDVKCDITTTDITTRTPDSSTSWFFYTQTGVFIANDGGSTDGTAHSAY